MKKVQRPTATSKTLTYLTKRSTHLLTLRITGQPININIIWKSSRQTKTIKKALQNLQAAMGPTYRCMYCVDSLGSDIEHYWPKDIYHAKIFEWQNWLTCCTDCGRYKGNRFPLDHTTTPATPLIVDPTVDDPWFHLDFDPTTGNITSRYHKNLGIFDAKGVETVKTLYLDSREGLAAAYTRTFKRLEKIVIDALKAPPINTTKLIDDLKEADDHGLLGWCFSSRGGNWQSFSTLRKKFPNEWNIFVQEFS